MIRLATVDDAEQLNALNDEFNGKGETTVENILSSLQNNRQEVVIVAEDSGALTGFVCVQLKKSFCYDEYMPEITEVYVKKEYRKNGIASAMVNFAEKFCNKEYPLHKFELLTGKNNRVARRVYSRLGYKEDGELHFSKKIK